MRGFFYALHIHFRAFILNRVRPKGRKKNYQRLLATNIAILILGSFFIIILSSMYVFLENKSNKAREIDKLRDKTVSAVSRTQNLLDTVEITVKLLDEWIQSNPDADPRYDRDFNGLVETFREDTERKIDLRMVTNEGGLYYLPSNSKEPLADVSDREYFQAQKTLEPRTLYFSAPVQSRVTNTWNIPVSFKLRENKFGIVCIFAALELSMLDEIYADILFHDNRSVTIVRSDGLVLAHSPYNKPIVGSKIPFSPKKEGFEIIPIYAPSKESQLACYQALDGLPVYILVSQSFSKTRTAWIISLLRKIAIAVAILLGFLFLNIRQILLLRNNNEVQNKLEQSAHIDSLTEMKNRRYFFERFAEEIDRAKRTNNPIVLLVADIDHFKYVNDTFGHPEGDRILKQIARTIENNVRNVDIAGRVGGEEFAVLLTDTGLESGIEVAERIRAAAAFITIDTWQGGLSVGVAEWKGGGESIDLLYKRADDALYAAKGGGRNRVVVASA